MEWDFKKSRWYSYSGVRISLNFMDAIFDKPGKLTAN